MAEASEQFAAVEAIWPGQPDLTEHRRRLAVELGRAEAVRAYRAASGEEQRTFEKLLVRQLVDPSSGSREVEAAAQAEFAHYAPTAYALAAHYTQLGDMPKALARSEEHTSELQSLMRIS